MVRFSQVVVIVATVVVFVLAMVLFDGLINQSNVFFAECFFICC